MPIYNTILAICLLTVGKFKYPNQVTFAEALKIAQTAISKFDGKMSNKDVAETLGYKVKNPDAISGYIFRKMDDLSAYNLMKRQRGFMKVTDVAIEALDPYDPKKAQTGKVKALLQMPIVNLAFETWSELPSETAFPSKLNDLLGVSWQEVQKHAEPLRKLISEAFRYLSDTHEAIEANLEQIKGELALIEKEEVSPLKTKTIGELRTEEYGILKIKDEVSIAIAIQILQSLKDKLTASKEDRSQKTE